MPTNEQILYEHISEKYLNKEGEWLKEPILKAMEKSADQRGSRAAAIIGNMRDEEGRTREEKKLLNLCIATIRQLK